METTAVGQVRRPRFHRTEPPPFRLTDDDVEIVRQIARHRFLRSTHIAALVGRSLDRTNDRLERLFHAAYVDRPRAQLDRFPASGSGPMVYALANRGVRLLRDWDGVDFRNAEWSRKNREAGRPFIEHQVSIVDFQVALRCAARERADLTLIDAGELLAGVRDPSGRNPFALRAKVSRRGTMHDFSVIPDFVFALQPAKGARRNYAVEIDRGTMPVRRSDFTQTSIERKLLGYLAAHAAREHERQLGWKNFRVLIVTNDHRRMQRMVEVSRLLHVPRHSGTSLFLFATFDALRLSTVLADHWTDGGGRAATLI